jgi:hypothetical protein
MDLAQNLGAFQFTLSYNASILTYQSLQVGPFIGSTGRTVLCTNPFLQTGSVSYSCVTLGSAPPGPSGTGTLATVHFLAMENGTSPMTLSNIVVTDITGAAQQPAIGGGVVDVGATPTPTATATDLPPPVTPTGTITAFSPVCADLSGDHLVRVLDLAIIVSRYGTYDAQMDFDGNGIVLVSDILVVVVQYGTSC